MNTFVYVLLLVIILPIPFLFFWFIYYSFDKRAKRVIELLPKDTDAIYTDVRIWFKGYDMLKKTNKFLFSPTKALYAYNLADLFLFADGLVVIGKIRAYGKIRMLSPFVIRWPDGSDKLWMVPESVRYAGVELLGQDIDISFQDADYTNIVKLEAKKIGEDLYEKMRRRIH